MGLGIPGWSLGRISAIRPLYPGAGRSALAQWVRRFERLAGVPGLWHCPVRLCGAAASAGGARPGRQPWRPSGAATGEDCSPHAAVKAYPSLARAAQVGCSEAIEQ